ncbi:hypothetical protein FXO37_18007 [Capsicum annuum]|nr:hypothetical protein FXO37_18007 [Capsicum annuum]
METAKHTVQYDAVLPAAATANDDDTPTLSSHTLEALKEFLAEQSRAQTEAPSATAAEDDVALVSEDWRLSQFWYNRETAETVANEVLNLCRLIDSPAVACIACPTLYAYLKVRYFKL